MLEVKGMRLPNGRTVSLSLPAGIHHLSGDNGAGKSLTLKGLALLVPAPFESYTLDGVDVTGLPPAPFRRQLLYTPPSPWETLGTVAEYFETPLSFKAYLGHTPPTWAREELEKRGLWVRELARLSSGEKQSVQLLRALALTPRWLLLDEPTGHMDAHRASEAEGWIRQARALGTSVLMVGHDPGQPERLGARRWRMGDL